MNEIKFYDKLEELRKTRFNKETYTITEVPGWIKYGEDFGDGSKIVKIPLICDNCKKEIFYETFKSVQNDIDMYNELVSDFNKLGVIAKFRYHCDDCCESCCDKNFEFWLKLDENFYYRTYPVEFNYFEEERYSVSYQEYVIALNFLKACIGDFKDFDGKQKNSLKLSYKALYYPGLKSGFIKPIVDLSLYKVFDLIIKYDREELKDNIKFILKKYTEKECCGFLFEDDDTIPISKQKYDKLVSIVEDIIDNKNLDEISVLDYFEFLKSLQFLFEYDEMQDNCYNNHYISIRELENKNK